jgi:3-oxoacyl-[acyl-carrier-protein] synthase-3
MTKKSKKHKSAVRAAITGVHGYVPPDVLTNAELSRMVDTSNEWIIERTGIKERHILKGKGLGTSHMGAEAVRGLLKKTGTAPSDVDLLICATTTPDLVFPSTANLICDMADIRNIGSFDVQAACSGFVYALTIAAQFVESGTYRKVIVVGADKMSAIIDYTDRATCVLFGDGAGAVLIEPNRKYGIRRRAAAVCRRPRRPSPSACTMSIRKARRCTNSLSRAWPMSPPSCCAATI